MAKKKTAQRTVSAATPGPTEFNPEVCQLKHIAVDKELENLKTDAEKRHNELVGMIQSMQQSIKDDVEKSHSNLKDKIVLTEKTIGGKIDKLNEFDDSLKGNGSPGVWESIRSLTWKFRIMLTLIIVVLVISLGGDFRGVTFESIKKSLGIKTTKIEESTPPGKLDMDAPGVDNADKKIEGMEEVGVLSVIPEKENDPND